MSERERLQDEAIRVAQEWRDLAKTFDEKKIYEISGKSIKDLCRSFEIIADSYAQVIEKL